MAVALVCGLARIQSSELCLDDSYIHLAYARSLRAGEGLSYNPHDWETGATSPLWVLLLAAWPFGLPGGLALKLFGLAWHVLGTWLFMRLAAALLPPAAEPPAKPSPSLLSTGAALLFACDPLAVQAATSGMEVSLATALALGFVLALHAGRPLMAAGMAAFCCWTRPELSVLVGCASVGCALTRRSRAALWPLLAALLASASYAAYCQAVSGYPLPNTYYVKGRPFALEQLKYLVLEVLPQQPLVTCGLGAVLAAIGSWQALRARSALAWVLFAALTGLLATGATRAQYPGVQFAQSRYFAPFFWLLPLAAAAGVAHFRKWPALGALGIPLAFSLFMCMRAAAVQHAQEQGVTRLHVEPARFVSTLSDVRVLGVEGAGALRYFTPRSLRVVDVVGLNDRRFAHVRGKQGERLCRLLQAGITHFAYPEPWSDFLNKGFELQRLAAFTQPAYAQTVPPLDWTVIVARVRRVRSEALRSCGHASPADAHGPSPEPASAHAQGLTR